MRLQFWKTVGVLACNLLSAGCADRNYSAEREEPRTAPDELLGTWRWVSSRGDFPERTLSPDSGQVVTITFSGEGRFAERDSVEQRTATYEIGSGVWEATERMPTVLLDSSNFFNGFSPVLEFGYRISSDTLELRSFSSHAHHHFFIRQRSGSTE